MKALTAKQAIADILADGWPGDKEAHKRAVSRLVVAKEIKRLQVTGAN